MKATAPGLEEAICDYTGQAFPVSYDALKAGGAPMLTRLFRGAGALDDTNSVQSITHWEEFFGGGMGRKVVIDVEYATLTDAPRRLFAKFTREADDPLQALFSPVMAPEVRFALLSRRPNFPVAVPQCLFAGYNAASLSGLLITSRVPYGEQGILAAMDKAVDYELGDLLPVYEAQTRAIARLAGFHHGGGFGSEVTAAFPFDPANEALFKVIPFDAPTLSEKLDILTEFAQRAPQLLPDGLADPAFLEDFGAGVSRVLEKERAVWQTIYSHDQAIALIHWNMNPDNAWFWRGEGGVMQSGQLDWGGVGQGSIAQSYYGMYCAAETDFILRHDASLQALLLAEYQACGGPGLDAARFDRDVSLAIAVLGVAWMLDAPSLIASEIPDYGTLSDRKDPRIRQRFLPRAQLQLMRVFLSEWRRKGIGTLIEEL